MAGRPDHVVVMAAARAPSAVVGKLLLGAEAGIVLGAMLLSFVESSSMDAVGEIALAPDGALGVLDPVGLRGVRAAAHLVFGVIGRENGGFFAHMGTTAHGHVAPTWGPVAEAAPVATAGVL